MTNPTDTPLPAEAGLREALKDALRMVKQYAPNGIERSARYLAAEAAVAALAAAPPPAEEPHEADIQRPDEAGRRMHAGGTGRAGVASGDDAGAGDVRDPAIRSEKRCFTYCGDDKCDCGLAEGISLERNVAARQHEQAGQPTTNDEAEERQQAALAIADAILALSAPIPVDGEGERE